MSDVRIEPRDRLPVMAKVHGVLRRRIAEGVYPPHSYLPAERELAQSLRTSRVTIARAVDALEREGLVIRAQGRGTRVLPLLKRESKAQVVVVHADHLAEMAPEVDAAHAQGSLRALRGVTDTLKRLACGYEAISIAQWQALHTDEALSRFGGLVFVDTEEELRDLPARRVPVAVAKLETEADVCATWVDHREPTLQAVRTFVGLGHQRIAFVGREPEYGFYARAREGYLAGMAEAGLPVDEPWVTVCRKTDALSGYIAARSLLGLPKAPTAIVAGRDTIAEGVCHAIEEAGLRVGQDISVIGFDDTTWPEGRQFLTTFGEPCYEMGAAAAEMIVEQIVNGWRPPVKRKFDTPFVLRRSAGPYVQP